eukprot:5659173-Pyramimonas_sp.AAC.1
MISEVAKALFATDVKGVNRLQRQPSKSLWGPRMSVPDHKYTRDSRPRRAWARRRSSSSRRSTSGFRRSSITSAASY